MNWSEIKCIFVRVTLCPLSSSQRRNIDQRRTEAALQKGRRTVWFAFAIMIAHCEQSLLESRRPLRRHGDEPEAFLPPVADAPRGLFFRLRSQSLTPCKWRFFFFFFLAHATTADPVASLSSVSVMFRTEERDLCVNQQARPRSLLTATVIVGHLKCRKPDVLVMSEAAAIVS